MKFVSLAVVVLYFQFSSLPHSESRKLCPEEWKPINNSCIHVSNITASWQDAKDKCNGTAGSQLVSIKNQDMNNQIVDILKNVTNGSYAEFYIGLSIKKSDKRFKWIDGASYNYSNWRNITNVTNATFPSGVDILCVFFSGADLKWLLKTCNMTRRFICQQGFSSRTTPELNGNMTRTSTTNAPGSFNGTTTGAPSSAKTSEPRRTTSRSMPNSIPAHTPSSTSKSNHRPTSSSMPNSHHTLSSTPKPNQTPSSTPRSTSENKFSNKTKSDMTIEDILNLVKDIEKEGKERIDRIKQDGNITETKIVPLYDTTNLVAEVAVVPTNGNSSLTFPSSSLGGNIMLPNSVFNLAKKFENNSDAVGITSVFLPGLGKTKDVLNSGVISTKVDVPPGAMDNLKEPVIISLPHGKELKGDQNSSCAFIDISNSKWSTAGCRVFSSNSTFTVCHCSHLTSFAVLMDVHGTHDDMPEKHKFALLIVSIVGCCIALVCFVAALIAFYVIVSERRRRKTETVAIHRNLAIAEIFALIFFLVAYVAVDSKGVCFAVAFLLHYFLMAVFFWMFIEGINLHRGLVQVFVTSSRMKFYNVLGWVAPLLFVVPTAAVGRMDYVREDFCWISQQFIWVFAGPVAVILCVNLIILCIAIRVMIKRPRYKMNQIDDSNKTNLEQELRIAFKTTVILLPLLGITWCLGFIATQSTTGNIVIQYLFAIINSLQGLYFFFAHCVYDEDVKKTASQQIRNCCNRVHVIRATTDTSTRIKSYFSRTLSHSGQSGRSGSGSLASNSKRTSAFCNASYEDGRVFEMPPYTSETNKHKITVDSTTTKASVIANGNHPNINGVTNSAHSPVKDVSKEESTNPVPSAPIHTMNSTAGFDAYFGPGKPSSEQGEMASVPQGTGSPNPQFFRRARSAIVKLSSKNSFPRRANSLSDHLGTRRPLSKQTSSDSSHSGNSNTPILFSGC